MNRSVLKVAVALLVLGIVIGYCTKPEEAPRGYPIKAGK